MRSHIFLDESGDLGWKFDKPYRYGGSSRYLTIAYLISPITHCDIPRRLVRDFYSRFGFNPKNEVKAADLKPHHREFICTETVKMMSKRPEFHLGAVTVSKTNAPTHIQTSPNNLYHYLMHIGVSHVIHPHLSCKITRDDRSVKAYSRMTCIEYLQTINWFHLNGASILTDNPTQSHTENGIIFIDWITNIMWSKYEDKYPKWADSLGGHVNETKLYFS